MDFSTLNPRQQEAVEAPESPLLIVAGAGTGKTRTLAARILYLIAQGTRPDALCAITFTNKAATEMRERVELFIAQELDRLRKTTKESEGLAGRQLMAAKNHPPFIGTFHSLGARILREHARRLQRLPNFAIFDSDDSFSLIKKAMKNLGIRAETLKPAAAMRKISNLKNGSLARSVLETSPRQEDRKILEIFSIYEEELRANNGFDFDDLLVQSVNILSHNPDIAAAYQRKYSHVLVDEYQDINQIQYALLRLLAAGTHAITVVGDDSQTIYGWRGSDIKIFLDFEKDWPGARTVVLDENYRSTPTIITAASALIARNEQQKPKKLWTQNPDGERIAISEWGSEDEEASRVAEDIANLLRVKDKEETPRITHGSETPRPVSIAVLYRTNAQSRAIEQALIERGISYEVFGGLKFYERKEIRDIMAALRFVYNPHDSLSRERLQKTFYQRKTAKILEHLAPLNLEKPHIIIEKFLDVAAYYEYLETHFTNADERRENISELIYFASLSPTLGEFLEHASLLQSGDAANGTRTPARGENPSALGEGASGTRQTRPIQLMTIHLAKGLEFDHVFLIGAREDLLPHAFSLDSQKQIEEERRLLYVAMTRARKTLHINYHDIPSRFLFEIPEEFTSFRSSGGYNELSDDEEKYISFD